MSTTPRSTTVGAAAGAALAIAGAASALFITVGGGTSAHEPTDPTEPVIEYVDQAGNPVGAPMSTPPAAPPPVIEFVDAATGEPIEAGRASVDPAPAPNSVDEDEYDEDDDLEYGEDDDD